MKLKNKKIFCILVVISIFFLITMLVILNYEEINNIFTNRKMEELNKNITFQVYSNENDMLKILVTAKDTENGINKLIYLTEDGQEKEINCYGKTQVTLDYIVRQNGEYEFKIISQNNQEITETLVVDDNYRNNVIGIYVSTEKNIDTQGDVTIEYPENQNATKMYKIGENGTWTEYTGKFTIDSYDIIEKNLQNADTKKVDIYAKLEDNAKNIVQIKKEIENIDVDIPVIPNITYNGSDIKPVISSEGIILEQAVLVSIEYEERDDTDNYYSLDSGETWSLYTEEFETQRTIIMAKSIKKDSQLEIETTENCNSILEKEATKVEAYDNNLSTYQFLPSSESSQSTIYTTNEVIGRDIHIIIDMAGRYSFIRTPGYIIFYNGDTELQSITVPNPGSFYGEWTRFDDKITIPENTEKIVFSAPGGETSFMYLYEIQLVEE